MEVKRIVADPYSSKIEILQNLSFVKTWKVNRYYSKASFYISNPENYTIIVRSNGVLEIFEAICRGASSKLYSREIYDFEKRSFEEFFDKLHAKHKEEILYHLDLFM